MHDDAAVGARRRDGLEPRGPERDEKRRRRTRDDDAEADRLAPVRGARHGDAVAVDFPHGSRHRTDGSSWRWTEGHCKAAALGATRRSPMADSDSISPPSTASSRPASASDRAPPRPASSKPAALGALWRVLVGLLLGVAAVNLPFSLVATLLMTDPPVSPGMLVRSMLIFSVLPALAGRAILRGFRVDVSCDDGALRIERPGLALHVPYGAIASIEAWRLPAPGPGLAVSLRSGARLPAGLQTDDPDALLDLLAAAGVDAAQARTHPTVVYARERARTRKRGALRHVVKFVLFGALPAAIFFNAHQHIAYGGTLGQYHLQGAGPYVETAVLYWGLTSIFLVLYASVWRGLAETASLAAAWLAPGRAGAVRRAAERACAWLYYGGVPLLVLYRFLP
jgi:hypothetical protein